MPPVQAVLRRNRGVIPGRVGLATRCLMMASQLETTNMTMYPVEHASFTRIAAPLGHDAVVLRHQDGSITSFGSEAAFEIFKAGLRHTKYDLYDEINERWLVGTIDQLDPR